jgi:hypothetical protein
MKVKLRMFRIAVLVYVILVGGFALRARACDCYPPCGDCKRCEAGVCVPDNDQDQTGGYTCNEPDVCGYCQKCSGGACVDDDAGGNTDDVCVGCKTCQSGTCEDDDGECNVCQECSGGDCILRAGLECDADADCETEEYCDMATCSCKCDSGSCWEPESVPASSEVCADCTSSEGCAGTAQSILGYKKWVAVAPGHGGWCKHPTKTETVGFLYDCTEDWDVWRIAECIGEAPICEALCHLALDSGGNPYLLGLCAACLIFEGVSCIDDVCGFIDECTQDPDSASPIQKSVVDYGADWGVWHMCGSQ